MRQLIEKYGDILQVRTPLPFPLRWVNSYVFFEEGGKITLVDPGLNNESGRQHWEDILEQIGKEWEDIDRVVLTHHHPDHYGISGWIQHKSGAQVWMSRTAHAQAVRMWSEQETVSRATVELFRRHGMDEQTCSKMEEHFQSFKPLVNPAPNVSYFNMDERFVIGSIPYEMIETGGHAAGHISFYQADRKQMFCGDHVLPRITSNVSYLPGGDPNPLQSFMDGLKVLQTYQVNLAFPGHRDPFGNFHERIFEMLAHHEERLQQLITLLRERSQTAFELCNAMFGSKLSVHQLRFAMAEVIAHLIYLWKGQQAECSETDQGLYYRIANYSA